MNHWRETSKRNLLPLSNASEFHVALTEWSFTGNVRDCDDGDELECELCEHPDLLAQYEINNQFTKNILWVGSSCIQRFTEINVYDGNNKLLSELDDRKRELKRRYDAYCHELATRPIRELWKKSPARVRSWLKDVGKSIKAGHPISPANMFSLLEDLDANKIPYRAKLYKISMISFTDKLEIKQFDDRQFDLIKPVLKKSQLESALKRRHEAALTLRSKH